MSYDLTFWIRAVQFRYKNHRGEIGNRMVLMKRLYHGKTEYHPEEQWLLEGQDLGETGCPFRTFAVKDILNWIDCPNWLISLVDGLLARELYWKERYRYCPWIMLVTGVVSGFSTAVLLMSLLGWIR